MSARKIQNVDEPSIFAYHDYRVFLKELFNFWGEEDPQFSIRNFAKSVGLSHTFFGLVLKGERPLTRETAQSILPALNLGKEASDFFLLLVTMVDHRDPVEQELAYESVKKIRRFRKCSPKEFEVLEFLSRWYYLAIREMAGFSNFKRDAKWIQGRLREKVTLKEIRKALLFLEEKGFIAYDSRGRSYLPDKNIRCEDGVYRVALAKFHKHMLDQAKVSIDQDSKADRKQVASTAMLSQEDFLTAKKIIEEAQQKISELEANPSGNPDSVLYLNFSLFHLARNKQ